MRKEWPSYAIMGAGVAGLAWLFYCIANDVDPLGWFW